MIEAYIQCPNMIIFGLPNLSSSEKIVLIALIGLVWGDEKPHPISIRALAKIIHLSSAALCDSAKSAEEKQRQQEQGKYREGILTRLASYGYITVEYQTSERGKHSQVVITVHLKKIWEDNTAFKKEQGVYNLSTISPKGAYKLNTSAYNLSTQEGESAYLLSTSAQKLSTTASQNGSTSDVEAHYKNLNKTVIEDKDNKDSQLSKQKPDAFIDQLAPKLSTQLNDYDHIEENKAELKRLYQEAKGVDQPAFKTKISIALQAAKEIKVDELQRFGYESHAQYFFWYLVNYTLNTQRR